MGSKSKKNKKKKGKVKENEEKSTIEPKEENKKPDIFSLLDQIDEESLEKTRKTEESLKEGIKKSIEVKTIKEKTEDDISFRNIKKNIDNLLKIKNSHHINEEFEEAIIVSRKIIKFANRADLKVRLKEENEYIENTSEKLKKMREKRLKSAISSKIEGLKDLKEDLLIKEDYNGAIRIANKIINIANKADLKTIMEEEDKAILLIQQKIESSNAKIDFPDKIKGLQDIRNSYDINGKYEDAIIISKKIISIAKTNNLNDIIKIEEDFIISIENKIRKQPSKLEFIDQIEGLKNIKQAHYTKSEFEKAIKVSQKILKFANIARLGTIIKEEEDSIRKMQEKLDMEKSILNIEKEFGAIKNEYETLISHDDIEGAHALMEYFYNKYVEYPQLFNTPEINELIMEEKKSWIKYNLGKK